jgi:hypothetical protein
MSFQINWPQFDQETKALFARHLEETINEAALSSTALGKIAVTRVDPGKQVYNNLLCILIIESGT